LSLDVLRGENFVSFEDVGFRAVLEAELVHEGHLSIGDQADERVFRDKVDRLLEGVLKLAQLFAVDGRIDEDKEDWLGRGGLAGLRRNDVLNRGEVWHQLSWQLLL